MLKTFLSVNVLTTSTSTQSVDFTKSITKLTIVGISDKSMK